MFLTGFYLSLIVFALLALQTRILRNAIIYLSIYSLVCSIVYLLLGAPDVAIAEAVIGCTLSTILYLVALKKYRIFTVYYRTLSDNPDEILRMKDEKDHLTKAFLNYAGSKELQLDIITTSSSFKRLVNETSFDVIILHTVKGIWVYGLKNSYFYEGLVTYLNHNFLIPVHVHYLVEEEEWQEDHQLGRDDDV